ncbi:MAG: hypothetical protein IPM45_12595 [Acidimicrobiales bacterium]|nr:hypothetical protein [Acidimicrobiales bacterium]
MRRRLGFVAAVLVAVASLAVAGLLGGHGATSGGVVGAGRGPAVVAADAALGDAGPSHLPVVRGVIAVGVLVMVVVGLGWRPTRIAVVTVASGPGPRWHPRRGPPR